MQPQSEKHLYEYAVIRYVPRVEREEFVNVGLLMMCKRRRWIRVDINHDNARLRALLPQADCSEIDRQLEAFIGVADGGRGPIAGLEVHERFRWLTAVRSACIQTSRPHPGKTSDLDATFLRLKAELVD